MIMSGIGSVDLALYDRAIKVRQNGASNFIHQYLDITDPPATEEEGRRSIVLAQVAHDPDLSSR